MAAIKWSNLQTSGGVEIMIRRIFISVLALCCLLSTNCMATEHTVKGITRVIENSGLYCPLVDDGTESGGSAARYRGSWNDGSVMGSEYYSVRCESGINYLLFKPKGKTYILYPCLVQNVPIRLTQTPTRCSVHPLAGI